MICWITFFTTIFVCTIILITYVIFQLNRSLDIPGEKLEINPDKFRTGDLIGISYDSIRGRLVKIFTGSCWTHLCMIMKQKGKVYVIEIAHYNDDESGLIINTWEDFYSWNSSRIIGYRPYTGKRFPKRKLRQLIGKDKFTKYVADMFVLSWLKTMLKTSYEPEDKKRYYCSEFIAHILQESGVVKKSLMPSCYKPWEFMYGDLELVAPHSYGQLFILTPREK